MSDFVHTPIVAQGHYRGEVHHPSLHLPWLESGFDIIDSCWAPCEGVIPIPVHILPDDWNGYCLREIHSFYGASVRDYRLTLIIMPTNEQP